MGAQWGACESCEQPVVDVAAQDTQGSVEDVSGPSEDQSPSLADELMLKILHYLIFEL